MALWNGVFKSAERGTIPTSKLSRSTHKKGGLTFPPWALILATNSPWAVQIPCPWWFPHHHPSGRTGMPHIPYPHPTLNRLLPCSWGEERTIPACIHELLTLPSPEEQGVRIPKGRGTRGWSYPMRPSRRIPEPFPALCVSPGRFTGREQTKPTPLTPGWLVPCQDDGTAPSCTLLLSWGTLPSSLSKGSKDHAGLCSPPGEPPASLVPSRSGELCYHQGSQNSWMGSPASHLGGSISPLPPK